VRRRVEKLRQSHKRGGGLAAGGCGGSILDLGDRTEKDRDKPGGAEQKRPVPWVRGNRPSHPKDRSIPSIRGKEAKKKKEVHE